MAIASVAMLAGAAAAQAATASSAGGFAVSVSTTVFRSRTIGAGSSYTVNLTQVPADALSATFAVTARPTKQSTNVSVCAGRVVTAACLKTPVLTTSDTTGHGKSGNGVATVDLTGADRAVTVYSSTSAVAVSLQLTGYTLPVPQPTPVPGVDPSTSAPADPSASPSAEPSPSDAATTAPSATPGATSAPSPSWAPSAGASSSASASTSSSPSASPVTPSTSPTTPGSATTTPPPTTAPPASTPAPPPTTSAPPAPVKSGYPGPSNTGYRAGTALTVIEGDLHVTTANTVLDSVEVHGTVWVEAPGVVIRNSLITGRPLTSDLGLVMVQKPSYSVTIQDTEIYATNPSYHVNGIMGQNFTLRRVNIHDVIDQVDVTGNNVTIEDSWLHGNLHYAQDPNHANGPSHDDNIQVQVGSNLLIRHNTLADSHNAVLMVTQDAGVVSNLTYANNYTSNGGCSLNLAQKSYGPLQGFALTNNVFTRTQAYARCAVIADAPSIPLFSLSNNLWVDGQAISITPR